jgi:predicted DNA-binding transcriptional regulator YafY
LIAKIGAAVAERLRPSILEPASGAPPSSRFVPDSLDMAGLRVAIRSGRKVKIGYRDVEGKVTGRVIWPVTVAYFDATRIVAACCELRQDFRHFRTDRVAQAESLDERYRSARLWCG